MKFWMLIFFVGIAVCSPCIRAEEKLPPLERGEDLKDGEVSEQVLDHQRQILQLVADVGSTTDEKKAMEAYVLLREAAFQADVPLLATELRKGGSIHRQVSLTNILGVLGDQRAGDALRFELLHGPIESKREAVVALGKLRFDWPVPILAGQAQRPEQGDDVLAALAVSALGRIGSVRAIDALKSIYPNIRGAVKLAADWALDVAEKKISANEIDTEFPRGQKLKRYYKGMLYYFYQPQLRMHGSRPWLYVCIHDADREVDSLYHRCWESAKKNEVAVLVPYFDMMSFASFESFNLWGQRSDKRLLELVDHVAKYADVQTRELYLFGQGAGGDFVQRFVMAYPDRVARAVAQPQELTYLDPDVLFPAGIRVTPAAPDIDIQVSKFLKSELMFVFQRNVIQEGFRGKFVRQIQQYGREVGLRDRISFRDVQSSTGVDDKIVDGYLFHEN